jgi:small-conductance mechanosensitive channel
MHSHSALRYVSLFLIAVSLLIECIRTSERSFYSYSLFNEKNSSMKCLHFLVTFTVIVSFNFFQRKLVWLNCGIIGIALFMLVVRIRSQIYSPVYRLMEEVLYIPYIIGPILHITTTSLTLTDTTTILINVGTVVIYCIARRYKRLFMVNYSELIREGNMVTKFNEYLV